MGLRGFALLPKDRMREIARKGGIAAHKLGTGHEFTPAEATAAAKRGHELGTAHEFTTEEARIAGKKGGAARAKQFMAPAPAPQPVTEGV